jgi:hypothetical protein
MYTMPKLIEKQLESLCYYQTKWTSDEEMLLIIKLSLLFRNNVSISLEDIQS